MKPPQPIKGSSSSNKGSLLHWSEKMADNFNQLVDYIHFLEKRIDTLEFRLRDTGLYKKEN